MLALEERVEIARDPHAVFDFLTSPEHRPEWDRSVVSEILVSPAPVTVGSTVRTRMRVMGMEIAFEWRVTELDRPRAMAARSVTGTMPTHLRFRFEPTEEGCRVIAGIHAEPGGMLRLVAPMVEQATRSTLADGLARMLLEAQP